MGLGCDLARGLGAGSSRGYGYRRGFWPGEGLRRECGVWEGARASSVQEALTEIVPSQQHSQVVVSASNPGLQAGYACGSLHCREG